METRNFYGLLADGTVSPERAECFLHFCVEK